MRTEIWAPLAVLAAGACTTLDPGEPGNLVPPTVAEDPGLPAIEMNGSGFHLETFGHPASPVIVFLHGGPGGDYRSLLALGARVNGYSLADDYFLVYWDQRGAGLSRRHDRRTLTLDAYDADLDSLVNRYSPGRPVYLIGASWGGMYATEYINRHPDRVAGAVLIEPGPLDGATYEQVKDDMFDLDLTAEWLNDVAWSNQFLSPDDHIRLDYQRLLGLRESQPRFHQRKKNPEPMWRMGAAVNRYLQEDGQNGQGVADYDFTTDLDRFTTPVLFIAGSKSEVLGEDFQRKQMAHYPAASLEVVAGAGHDVNWTHPSEVLALVRDYLESVKGGVR